MQGERPRLSPSVFWGDEEEQCDDERVIDSGVAVLDAQEDIAPAFGACEY
jgi:hypothetical protein